MSIPRREELKRLISTENGLCASIYLPTFRGGVEVQQNSIRFKNLLRQTDERLQTSGVQKADISNILQPAHQLLDDYDFWQHQSDGLAVFLTSESLVKHRLPLHFPEVVEVGSRFYLKPMLPLFTGDGRFHVLALSQNSIRLFEASRHTMREMDLRDIPASLADALGYDWEERSLQFHSGAPSAASGGRRQAMFHGHGGGLEDSKEEVAKFCRIIDDGLAQLLDDRETPLIVAAVDYVTAIFREVSKHPNLVSAGVEGNPESLSEEELHGKAWDQIEPLFHQDQKEAEERFEERYGTGLASRNIEEVVPAAAYGRVDTLFVALNDHRWGTFDVNTGQLDRHEERQEADEDLLDLAAFQSLLHDGTVYAVEPDKVPGDGPLAAIFRY